MLEEQEEYHEDFGNCLFFHFENFDEPPDVCCGSPLDGDWNETYWTHFTRFDFNQVMDQAKKGKTMKQIKTIGVWECQDCGALYAKKLSCWCCVDMNGEYIGKRKGGYEIIKIGEFTKEQLESIT